MDTDFQGTAVLGSFPGEQILSASKDDLESPPWRGMPRATVELRLAASFTVGGRLILPSLEDRPDGGERVSLFMQTWNPWNEIATIPLEVPGSWGPVRVPWIQGARYRARFESTRLIPQERGFLPPDPGGHVFLDFQPEAPLELWFFVADDTGEAVEDAVLTLVWGQGDDNTTLKALARPDGYVYVGNAPPGLITYWASAPGYATCIPNSLFNPLPEPASLVVSLKRSGILAGRCLHAGVPVEEFQVTFWVAGTAGISQTRAFHAREDGSFTVEDAPAGPVYVTASSAELPACEPILVEVGREGKTDIVLALEEGILGRGIVVDATSGESISNATIQMHVAGTSEAAAPWGLPHPVRPDGSFEILGFTPRRNYYTVTAPGYSEFHAALIPDKGGPVELGRIALSGTQPLEIHLLGQDGDEGTSSYGGYTLDAMGATDFALASCDNDGVFRKQEVSAGAYEFSIRRPDHSVYGAAIKLVPGEEWSLRLRVAGDKTATVRVRDEHGNALGADVPILVTYTVLPKTSIAQRAKTDQEGIAVFRGIDAERIDIQVLENDEVTLRARATAVFSGSSALVIDVALGGRVLRVRVVEEDGDALSQAEVRLADPVDSHRMLYGVTDDDGMCSLLGAEKATYRAHLFHATLGRCYDLEADGRRDEIELVFKSGAELDLRLVDEGRPVVDARSAMWDPWGDVFDTKTTNVEGRVHYGPLAPGMYRFRAQRSGYWTVDFEAEAVQGGKETEAVLRRLGDAMLEMRTAEGMPAAGRSVGLHCVELDTDVAEWVEEGRVNVEGGLITDEQGKLLVRGLPHGTYEWEVADAAGNAVRGRMEVPAGGQVVVRRTIE
ncbi:MAG: Ig-like domain-containing protein [Planctomycetota bacterium]